MSSSRSATKRLLKELEAWDKERAEETGVERLGPVTEGDLMHWEAVINGRGIGGGYDGEFLSRTGSAGYGGGEEGTAPRKVFIYTVLQC